MTILSIICCVIGFIVFFGGIKALHEATKICDEAREYYEKATKGE